MKKIMLKLLTMSALLAAATFAYAAEGTIGSDYDKTIGGGSFKTSANVQIKVMASTTAYCAVSRHLNGTVEYGTLSSDPAIKKQTATAGVVAPTSCSSETGLPSGYQ